MSEKHNCWFVLCTDSQHDIGGYPIPLALAKGDEDIRGSIQDPFVVPCKECGKKPTYTASHIHKGLLTLPEGWEPHPNFPKS
jgi:hypothetical protein